MNLPNVFTKVATEGCTWPGCGTQNTQTLDGHNGRRCERHSPFYGPHQLKESK